MQRALYDPEDGYYRQHNRNPFGIAGDFYTAVQLMPVFGEAIASYVDRFAAEKMLDALDVIDLGAGSAGLGQFLRHWNYRAVDWHFHALPESMSGVVIANEFFDALPVHILRRSNQGWQELLVSRQGEMLSLEPSQHLAAGLLLYAERYGAAIPDGGLLEVSLQISTWMKRMEEGLSSGRLLIIDYGYNARELIRFPLGTLMSYRRHVASQNVLSDPGSRDITALVNFSELKRVAAEIGLVLLREMSLGAWILEVFGADGTEQRLQTADMRWRLQWKQLVVGLGETFRVLEFEKAHHQMKKASEQVGGLR
jgi:SAM-dependent MidA family methyltransferase